MLKKSRILSGLPVFGASNVMLLILNLLHGCEYKFTTRHFVFTPTQFIQNLQHYTNITAWHSNRIIKNKSNATNVNRTHHQTLTVRAFRKFYQFRQLPVRSIFPWLQVCETRLKEQHFLHCSMSIHRITPPDLSKTM